MAREGRGISGVGAKFGRAAWKAWMWVVEGGVGWVWVRAWGLMYIGLREDMMCDQGVR